MLRRLGHTLVFLAMFSIAGGHWAVLKSVAWAGMVISYSEESTLAKAVVKTFSGQAPCDMCRAIEKGKSSESKSPGVAQAIKRDGIFCAESATIPPPRKSAFSYPPDRRAEFVLRATAPPMPVPIAA